MLSSKGETAELTIPGNLDYKEYMNLCVSDLEDRNLMFHLCENCPDITTLSNCLKNILEDNDFDDDDKIISNG